MDFAILHDDILAADAVAAHDADVLDALTPTTAWLRRALVLEAVARNDASRAVRLHAASLARRLCGEDDGCCVLLGTSGGIELARPDVTARQTVDGLVLDGASAVVVNATRARVAVVRAVLNGGDVCVVVPAFHAGVSCAAVDVHGLRDAGMGRLSFTQAPARRIDVDLERALQTLRIDVATIAVGVADHAFEAARRWALAHDAAGKPLARQQAVHFKLADMKVELDGARLLTQQAAWRLGRGEDVAVLAALTKVSATEAALRVVELAMQVAGDEANDTANGFEALLRDARGLMMLAGSNDHLRELVAAQVLD